MSGELDWSTPRGIITNLLAGNLIAIFTALAVVLSVPFILHWLLYRRVASPPISTFVLLGPSGSGKTALLTLLESATLRRAGSVPQTRTSQTSTTITATLPPSVPIASNRYRSVNDPSLSEAKRSPVKYVLKDTPGHGKLRESQGLSFVADALQSKKRKDKANVKGIIYMVDAAALADSNDALRDAAAYLHDVLLTIQRAVLGRKRSAKAGSTAASVLVAANKQDLFTALPAGSVQAKLEAEIDRIRKSRQRGLMEAGSREEDEEDVLGGDDGRGTFTFALLEEEVGIRVQVLGGAVKSEGETAGAGVRKWEEWIGSCL
ncbi:hypothetical protein VTN49DRAFT_3300 [Thermomyces lanuginosus]|uniref:uncharacterized protein n=1 Tax=Thermomyces lanuginosus TaxID=5541 RepID=UPI0037437299